MNEPNRCMQCECHRCPSNSGPAGLGARLIRKGFIQEEICEEGFKRSHLVECYREKEGESQDMERNGKTQAMAHQPTPTPHSYLHSFKLWLKCHCLKPPPTTSLNCHSPPLPQALCAFLYFSPSHLSPSKVLKYPPPYKFHKDRDCCLSYSPIYLALGTYHPCFLNKWDVVRKKSGGQCFGV